MRKHRRLFRPLYSDGEPVQVGDRVLAEGRPAVVEAVMQPGSKLARDHYVEDVGGFMLKYDDGDYQLWHDPEDDLELVCRRRQRGPANS